MADFYDHGREQAAISAVCEMFDGMGLSLFERWHVCHCISMAASMMMGERASELCGSITEADLERIRESLQVLSSLPGEPVEQDADQLVHPPVEEDG